MLKYIKDSLIVSILVFVFMWVLGNLSFLQNLEMLNPFENVLNDFDMTDIVYSKLRDNQSQKPDTNIVIVNLGNLPRRGVADVIQILNEHDPKVIGIDAFFRFPSQNDPEGDTLFAEALSGVKNLVMVSQGNLSQSTRSKLDTDPGFEPDRFDTLELSNPMFVQYGTTGHANLISPSRGNNRDFVTIRTLQPLAKINDTSEVAFAVKIAELYKPGSGAKFLAREKNAEYINYLGNADPQNGKIAFAGLLDVENIFDPNSDLSFVKDKIVVMGFMGETVYSPSYFDKFNTPLNENYIGMRTLDMYGVVIHANIVSMILNEKYIHELGDWLNFFLMAIITFLSTLLFTFVFHKVGYWYDAIVIVLQLLIFIFILGIGLYAFDWYSYRVEINPAIIAVILSGIFVEIYYGLIKKLFNTLKSKRVKFKQTTNETA